MTLSSVRSQSCPAYLTMTQFPAWSENPIILKQVPRSCTARLTRQHSKMTLSLNQLATQVLQNGMDNGKIGSHSVPHSLNIKYQPMPEITMSVSGIIKLFCNLNPSKASGPDSIEPIALFLSVLF